MLFRNPNSSRQCCYDNLQGAACKLENQSAVHLPAVTISDRAFNADQLYFSKTVAVSRWLYCTQHILQYHQSISALSSQLQSSPLHASRLHASQVHANQVHASQVHAKQMHANQMHASQLHVSQMHASQLHASQVHASQLHVPSLHASRNAENPAGVLLLGKDGCSEQVWADAYLLWC